MKLVCCKKNLNFLILFFLFGFFFMSYTSAEEMNYSYNYEVDTIQITSLKYEPYPANPGEYFDIWIQASLGKYDYVKFELIENFPFSLDGNEDSIRIYENSENREVVMKYKVRVSEDAIDGTNVLELGYTTNRFSDDFGTKSFEISVAEVQTGFDAVVQEFTDSEVSIAIANVGKYAANSVVVRVPEQDCFRVIGTDGQMVGNLDSGDYTIVSFNLASLKQKDFRKVNSDEDFESNLKFNIYYTDTIGERRIVNMELPLEMGSSNFSAGMDDRSFEGFPGVRQRQDSGTNWKFIVFMIILITGGFIFYKRYPKKTRRFYDKLFKKVGNLFDKKRSSSVSSDVIPDWIKKCEGEEKKNGKR